ncbi:MAG: hypothetical protein E6H09_15245 [Bacteroidetes bacterium]|nr:MAG: hypothetical protein E6H09_15245 [Bacteroidota bacterium]
MRFPFLVIFFVFSISFFNAKGQDCTPPVALVSFTCGTNPPLSDGITINTGLTVEAGGTGSYSNITVNGGTLLICGTASITNLNFNSGSIMINVGAALTINGSFNTGSNLNFYNLGTTTFNVNVNIQGIPNFVYNAAGATITVNGGFAVFNNGNFLNNGIANAQAVTINTGATFCLGPGSISNTVSLQNDATNPAVLASGIACLRYTTTFTGNQPITASSNLSICQGPAASNPAPAVVGAAIVVTNCASCAGLLPLRLLSFKGNIVNGEAELEWTTAFEDQVRSFIIERRSGNQSFEAVGEVAARNQPSNYTFTTPVTKDSYFRLKMIDLDGKKTYSSTILLKLRPPDFEMTALFNPADKSYTELSITVSRNQRGELIVLDYMGRLMQKIPSVLIKGSNIVPINTASLSKGQYLVYFKGSEIASEVCRFARW